jgi:hypothetical protein
MKFSSGLIRSESTTVPVTLPVTLRDWAVTIKNIQVKLAIGKK